MRIAVVGVTGMVGKVMLDVLTERNIRITELIPVASEKSIGKTILFKGENLEVIGLAEALNTQPDIALFSAGGDTSLEWAPKFAENGTTVIDNSSAWRMKKHIKLVIPEINASKLTSADKIIANPNCSTIQMLVALFPIHKINKIKKIIVSTYQSVSGAGQQAMNELTEQSLSLIHI